MSKEKITHYQKLNREEVAGYFQDLANSIKTGKIAIEKNGQVVNLELPESLEVAFEAIHKRSKASITLDVSWVTEAEEVPAPLKILSQ